METDDEVRQQYQESLSPLSTVPAATLRTGSTANMYPYYNATVEVRPLVLCLKMLTDHSNLSSPEFNRVIPYLKFDGVNRPGASYHA